MAITTTDNGEIFKRQRGGERLTRFINKVAYLTASVAYRLAGAVMLFK